MNPLSPPGDSNCARRCAPRTLPSGPNWAWLSELPGPIGVPRFVPRHHSSTATPAHSLVHPARNEPTQPAVVLVCQASSPQLLYLRPDPSPRLPDYFFPLIPSINYTPHTQTQHTAAITTQSTHKDIETSQEYGCLVTLFPFTSYVVSHTGKIASSDPRLINHSTQPVLHPSESPLPGPLNFSSSPGSSSPRTFATIPFTNAPSFTTDTPPSWLTQPTTPQRPTPAPQQDSHPSLATDFVLYPPASTSRLPARHSTELSTAPSSTFQVTDHGQNRRNSTQSSSVPTVQNPRVTKIIQGSGHTSSSPSYNRFSLPGQKSPFYASSAPSSSAALQQHPSPRPQVPLFSSNSTGNVHIQHQAMHHLDTMSQGKLSSSTSSVASSASSSPMLSRCPTSAEMNSLFDMPSNFGEELAQDAHFDAVFSSPQFTSVNTPSTNVGTISPKDIMRDPLASAPPSTSFTNLTSPSILDSPDVADSFETSPMFANGDADLSADSWFSLFPGVSGESDESPLNPNEEIYEQAARAIQTNMDRRRSSPGQSPQQSRSTLGKHSSISGVGSRKRDKPLPPITLDDSADTVAVKRARNTLAARKSRQKKVERFEELEQTIEELRGEVAHWKNLALNGNA